MRRPTPKSRSGLRVLVLCIASVAVGGGCTHTEDGSAARAPSEEYGVRPTVTLSTTRGDLVIEIAPQAAPQTIARWLRLVEGSALVPEAEAAGFPNTGYYDGLAFTFTRPHVEIVTEARQPAPEGIEFDVELDAVSLGLDKELIDDHAEAMNVLQWELIPAHARMGKGDDRPDLLKEWIDEWRETRSPDFLIGESWQRVNEALGYVYQSGLQSLPVTAGAVALQSLSPTRASIRLSIAVADMPQRTGRWMVIGRVVGGLDVAEEISTRTLKGQGTPIAKDFEPLDPVVIVRTEIEIAR